MNQTPETPVTDALSGRICFPKGWSRAMRDKWLLSRLGLRLRAEPGLAGWQRCVGQKELVP